MTAKELKLWVDTLCPEAEILIKRYSWEELEYQQIKALHESSPPPPVRTMDQACNLEDAT